VMAALTASIFFTDFCIRKSPFEFVMLAAEAAPLVILIFSCLK